MGDDEASLPSESMEEKWALARDVLALSERTGHFYVFVVREREPDEDGLGPTYRLVCNLLDPDGRWAAKDASEAIRLAAQGRDDIYAAVPAETAVVERWPLLG